MHGTKFIPEVMELTADGDDSETREKTSTRRQTWSSQLDFIMTSVGCAVGLGNIWRFPYLCYKNGGGAFLIPYLLSFLLAAAPGYLLDVGLGQYMSAGPIRAWGIVPVFQGVGVASQVVQLYTSVYYIIVIVWALYYIYASFTTSLPWASCNNPWNTDRCFTTGMSRNRSACLNDTLVNATGIAYNVTTPNCTTNENVTSLPLVDSVEEYWERHVLDMSSGLDEPGSLVPGLTIALLVAWVLVYICICRGVRWTGKIVYFTALAPYLLLLVIFVRGVTLPGAVDGIVFYLKPDFTRLADAQVWLDGGTQVIYSIGVGQGFMITLGSYNKFNSNFVRNGLVVLTINSLTSVFGGLAVFAILGFMAHETSRPIAEVVSSGPGLVFLAYPKAVTQMPLSPLWSVLFFFTILLVGLDSEFATVESFLVSFIDRFPKVLYKTRNRMIFCAFYCLLCFILGLSMVTQGGVYLFRMVDFYCVSGLVLLTIMFLEVLIVAWIFGADRFYDCWELMLGYRVNVWFKFCWRYLTPLLINAIFWFHVATFKPLKFDDNYQYPEWSTGLGIVFALSSILCVPGVAIYMIFKSEGTIRQRLRDVTTPVLKKHQIFPGWKDSNYTWKQVEYRKYDANDVFNLNDTIDQNSDSDSH